ncbi:hypothetical protein EGT67_03505 [Prescottella agglutinans]|uniref:Phasin domain-containing protein n=1 Tax=Prescottella agglutinans TaxID=1644129 RepID=A0A438BKK1_9NOCA|nr:hypothetical protein [Prescottella agglutinans]RVW11486.1 hypothetical protein EGT67_03505 [Prescottella agglutinans]
MAAQSTTAANTTANTAATARTTAKNTLTDGIESVTKSFDENLDRVQSLNEKFVDAAKLSGTLTLDAYEKALSSVLDFNKSIATTAKLDWVSAVVDAQTSLVRGISTAATTAAREVLQ